MRELGFEALDVDSVVRDIYAQNEIRERMREALGKDTLVGGEINRDWLRATVTRDGSKRRILNGIVHKPVMERVLAWMGRERGQLATGIAAAANLRFVEIPLLIETATQGLFDRVWVVQAGKDEQMKRLTSKLDGDAEMAERLLATQLPTEAKVAFADAVIRTNQPFEAVRVLVTRLAEEVG